MYIFLPVSERSPQKLPIYPITLGYGNDQRTIRRPNGASFHHFLCVSEGEGFFNLNGTTVVLKEGTVIFLRKGFPVDYGRTGSTFITSWVTFDGEGVDGILDYFGAGGYVILHQKSPALRVAELCKMGERGAPIELLSAKTYELAIDFFTLFKKQHAPPILEKAREFIRQHYGENLSVADISESVNISQSLLFKLFRTEENATPMEYLRRVRIEQAKKLLFESQLKICDISTACGFSDTAYFCKVFKDQTGSSPASYRKSLVH